MDGKKMKKIPYGKCNFEDIRLQNMYYVDKSRYIREVEDSSDFFFFIRPRRFGKSLFLSMLENYYDMNRREKFDSLFGDLWIGQHPTEQRNSYAVMTLDFSCITAGLDRCEENFNTYCREVFVKFCDFYKNVLPEGTSKLMREDNSATENFIRLVNICSSKNIQLYLLIDEYDNFTNTVLSDVAALNKYESITHKDGFYRNFFATLKAATRSCLKKIFLTGVSPVTLDDLTSGFNINFNYTSYAAFNEMMGFTEVEVRAILDYYRQFHPFNHTTDELIDIIKPWYDNYCFSKKSLGRETLYNSDMVFYFVNAYIGYECQIPTDMLDANIRIDYKKLMMLVRKDHDLQTSVIQEIVKEGRITSELNDNFPAKNISDRNNFISLLYYFGLLTVEGTFLNKLIFKIPNQVVREQMFDYLVRTYDEVDLRLDYYKKDELGVDMALNGNWRPYFQAIADAIMSYSSQRDKIKGEYYVHGFTFAMTLQNPLYLPVSENDTATGYSDVYLQPRLVNYPELQHSYIVEFKYVKSSEPDSEVEAKRAAAIEQINNYAQTAQVRETIGHTTLHKIVQVYKGFELKVLEEIE
ncbi:MAG: ATP-binding protein [Paludibacteraceae bacterium]|nr:ATP-binding protein [Paludibacteraceae bacterium]